MTDNLEVLERDWPAHRFKNIPKESLNRAYAIIFTVLAAAYAFLHVMDARRLHVDGWQFKAVELALSFFFPWAAMLFGYRRLKKAAPSLGISENAWRAIQSEGWRALMVVYMALMLILTSTLLH